MELEEGIPLPQVNNYHIQYNFELGYSNRFMEDRKCIAVRLEKNMEFQLDILCMADL